MANLRIGSFRCRLSETRNLILLLLLAFATSNCRPSQLDTVVSIENNKQNSTSEDWNRKPEVEEVKIRKDGDCEPNREFKCSSERRCIPIEWRCDFTEQCLDGEDEFRCVTDWCDFDESLCNWRNSFPARGLPLEMIEIGKNNNKLAIWRRLSPNQQNLASCGASVNKTGSECLLRRRLAELSSQLKLAGRFAYVPMVLVGNNSSQLFRRSAQFSSSQIGQTNSMCQIRFKYALWMANLTNKEEQQRGTLELNLFSRRQNELEINLLWSSRSKPSKSSDWISTIVELGHLKNLELYFEATLSLSGRRLPVRAAAIAAITNINFRDCAWPGRVERFAKNNTDNRFELLSDFSFEDYENYDDDPDETYKSFASDYFRCSNGIRLEGRKLCNFVDDCMTATGELEDESEELCGQLAGRESFETLPSSYYLLAEDGGQLFGQTEVANKDGRRSSESQWTLAGNWPSRLIKITNRRESAKALKVSSLSWLPQFDHTFNLKRQPEGHYLSLELPASWPAEVPTGQEKQSNKLLWLYLYSPLLVKAAGADESTPHFTSNECRLKFFYNLVTNQNFTGRNRTNQLPYKSYITVEHFLAGSERRPLNGTGSGSDKKPKLDSFIFSHLIGREKLKGARAELGDSIIMELPGEDFWREVNVEVKELKPGDIFYIRLAIIAERSETTSTSNEVRMSLNIDDLSSHFGCQLAKKLSEFSQFSSDEKLPPTSLSSFDDEVAEEKPISTPITYNRRRPRRPLLNSNGAIQFEPSKLIVCVFGLLAAILGLMMLIVFVVVPYVEKITINYHDQLSANLDELDTNNNGHSSNHSSNFKDMIEACELTTESDWEQVSRQWRRSAAGSSANLSLYLNNSQNQSSTNLMTATTTTPLQQQQPDNACEQGPPEVAQAGKAASRSGTLRLDSFDCSLDNNPASSSSNKSKSEENSQV